MDDTIRQKNLASRYDGVANIWRGKISKLGYPAAYKCLIERCNLAQQTGLNVLDAGAGTGDFSKAFLACGHMPSTLTLLDISSEMLRVARTELSYPQGSFQFVKGEIEGLNNVESYDVILCAHVIEHCEDPVATLACLHTALAPEGVLLLVASKPHWCTAFLRMIWGHKAFKPTRFQGFLAAAGFAQSVQHPFTSGPPSRTSMGYIARKIGDKR